VEYDAKYKKEIDLTGMSLEATSFFQRHDVLQDLAPEILEGLGQEEKDAALVTVLYSYDLYVGGLPNPRGNVDELNKNRTKYFNLLSDGAKEAYVEGLTVNTAEQKEIKEFYEDLLEGN